MIALDTNVLVRFVVEDDEKQTQRATALIRSAIERDERLFVSDVVMCELVWVLETAYEVSRSEIVAALRQLLRARHLDFEDSDLLARALAAFRDGKGDYADYIIRGHAVRAGCTSIATFDKALLREPGFVAP